MQGDGRPQGVGVTVGVLPAPAHAAAGSLRPTAAWRVVGLRLGVLTGAALLVAVLPLDRVPLLSCLLRAATGLPCPLCGSTTAAGAVGRGDPLAALAANPVTVLGAGLLVLAPLGPAARWWGLGRRPRLLLLGGALTVAEAWQLVRVLA